MALKHGRSAVILFGALDLSGYLHGSGMEVDVANADSTTFVNAGWESNLAGMAGAVLSFDGYSDITATATLTTALQSDSGVLSYCPGGGSAIGDRARLVAVTATGYGESPSADATSPFSWAVGSQSPVAFGDVLHPLAEDTNTTTGSSRDDSAATSTGWVAHLHVTAVDGGSWVVKLEDSANNSAWSDVSGGAFTAATGATSQRLVSSSTTADLRRYVRYTATRTGGTGGDGVTFFLAYARLRAQ